MDPRSHALRSSILVAADVFVTHHTHQLTADKDRRIQHRRDPQRLQIQLGQRAGARISFGHLGRHGLALGERRKVLRKVTQLQRDAARMHTRERSNKSAQRSARR